MTIYIIIKNENNVRLNAFFRYELALNYVEVMEDRKIKCHIQEQKVSDKLPNWMIKHLEEKYL